MSFRESPLLGILRYPGAQESAVLGLADLFAVANRLAAGGPARGSALRVRVLDPQPRLRRPPRPFTALILPPSLEPAVPAAAFPRITPWLRDRYAEGTQLCSVCAGAFLLAETGLLDGRRATTHWALAEPFRERFPRVALDPDRLLVDEGDLLTAGGLMAWVDLGLELVARHLGRAARLATARHLLVDPGGREQRFYGSFAPPTTHGDAAVLKVQRWLQGRGGEALTVAALARRAALGERTFLRRFVRATGLRPTEYLQHLRVEQARRLLEETELAIDQVAWEVGYHDPSAFRRVFLRVLGLSPGEYRRRFRVA